MSSFKQTAAVGEGTEIGMLARRKTHSSIRCSDNGSRAAGNWRNEASVRFMLMWKLFLDHENAPLDSQYDTVRQIYGQLVGRFGAEAQTNSRER